MTFQCLSLGDQKRGRRAGRGVGERRERWAGDAIRVARGTGVRALGAGYDRLRACRLRKRRSWDAPGTNPRYSVIFYANKLGATARLHPPADALAPPRGRRGRGRGREARGASLGRSGAPGGRPRDIHPVLVKCFAAILGIGKAGSPAHERRARGERETFKSTPRAFSTSRQASIGNVAVSQKSTYSLMSSSSSSSAVFRASTVGRDCTTRRPPWWRTFSSRVAHARTPRVVSPRAPRAGLASHRAPR